MEVYTGGKQIGYIRVSSISQHTERQLIGIDLDKIFEDKVSAKDTNRVGLRSCLDYLREDDVLHVHSIDRLARNLIDLQQIVGDFNQPSRSVALICDSGGQIRNAMHQCASVKWLVSNPRGINSPPNR